MIRTTNTCCGNEAGLVEKFIGTAYDVVKTVYENLGELQFIYDFLNKYGVLIAVSSVQELQALPTTAKYTRVYSTSTAGERIYTDYLYVEGDRTGVLPNDPTATGSWVIVGTSTSGGSGASGGYIPFVYNNGSALGGETTITVPDGTVGVPFIIVNGYTNYVGKGFTYSVADLEVTLAQPLETGDEVVLLLTGVPAVPDNPNVDNWTVINWLYNQGAAVGGEQVIQIPYTFQDIPAVYKNGLRFYKGLTTNSYTIDADNQRIILTEVLATNDRLIVQIGGELVTLEVSDRTLEEVARSANVKDSEVILSTNTTSTLNGKKIVFDVTAQKSYGLPMLPTNVYISSVSNGQLTYQPGNVTVNLLPIPNSGEAVQAELDKLHEVGGLSEVGKATYAQIRAYTGNSNEIRCIGRTSSGDGGEGIFDLVVGDTTTPDDDGVYLVSTNGARWKRRMAGKAYYAVWFGVKADYVNSSNKGTDNAVMGQNAINAIPASGGALYWPMGKIRTTNMWSVNRSNITQRGCGDRATVIFPDGLGADKAVFEVNNGSWDWSTGTFAPDGITAGSSIGHNRITDMSINGLHSPNCVGILWARATLGCLLANMTIEGCGLGHRTHASWYGEYHSMRFADNIVNGIMGDASNAFMMHKVDYISTGVIGRCQYHLEFLNKSPCIAVTFDGVGFDGLPEQFGVSIAGVSNLRCSGATYIEVYPSDPDLTAPFIKVGPNSTCIDLSGLNMTAGDGYTGDFVVIDDPTARVITLDQNYQYNSGSGSPTCTVVNVKQGNLVEVGNVRFESGMKITNVSSMVPSETVSTVIPPALAATEYKVPIFSNKKMATIPVLRIAVTFLEAANLSGDRRFRVVDDSDNVLINYALTGSYAAGTTIYLTDNSIDGYATTTGKPAINSAMVLDGKLRFWTYKSGANETWPALSVMVESL